MLDTVMCLTIYTRMQVHAHNFDMYLMYRRSGLVLLDKMLRPYTSKTNLHTSGSIHVSWQESVLPPDMPREDPVSGTTEDHVLSPRARTNQRFGRVIHIVCRS